MAHRPQPRCVRVVTQRVPEFLLTGDLLTPATGPNAPLSADVAAISAGSFAPSTVPTMRPRAESLRITRNAGGVLGLSDFRRAAREAGRGDTG